MSEQLDMADPQDLALIIADELISANPKWVPREIISNLILMMNEVQMQEIMGIVREDTNVSWKLGTSAIRGMGLFSVAKHEEGEKIFEALDLSQFRKTTPMNNVNHSDEPNVELRVQGTTAYGIALKDVEAGEELTINYPDLPWLMVFDRRIPGAGRTGERVPPIPGRDDPDGG